MPLYRDRHGRLQHDTGLTLDRIGSTVAGGGGLLDSGSNGIVVRTAAGGVTVARSLVAPAAGLTIANPAGIAGDPTFALANDLAALEALAATGFPQRTGVDTWSIAALANTDLPNLTSAQWATHVTDETGTGVWVFGTSPTFTTDITVPLIYGGTASGTNLDLYANNVAFAAANAGRIRFQERIVLLPSSTTFSSGTTNNKVLIHLPSTSVITVSTNSAAPTVMSMRSEIKLTAAVDNSFQPTLFEMAGRIRLTVAGGPFASYSAFRNAPIYTSDGINSSMALSPLSLFGVPFVDLATFTVANGGTWDAGSEYMSFKSAIINNSGTRLGTRYGYVYEGDTGDGFATEIAIYLTNMLGTNNVSLYAEAGAYMRHAGLIADAYACGSGTILTGFFSIFADELVLSGTEAITLQGTATLRGV